MEIVNSKSALLSNFEVMKHLQTVRNDRKKNKGQGQLATITYETLRYLEAAPCGQQTEESITNCMKALAAFNLNKSEKLMIINAPPATALEVQLLIEDSEERLSEDQVRRLLEVIVEHFPFVKKEEQEPDDTGDIKEEVDDV